MKREEEQQHPHNTFQTFYVQQQHAPNHCQTACSPTTLPTGRSSPMKMGKIWINWKPYRAHSNHGNYTHWKKKQLSLRVCCVAGGAGMCQWIRMCLCFIEAREEKNLRQTLRTCNTHPPVAGNNRVTFFFINRRLFMWLSLSPSSMISRSLWGRFTRNKEYGRIMHAKPLHTRNIQFIRIANIAYL